MKHARGFTFIEIFTVIPIIGILAAIAIPSFKHVPRLVTGTGSSIVYRPGPNGEFGEPERVIGARSRYNQTHDMDGDGSDDTIDLTEFGALNEAGAFVPCPNEQTHFEPSGITVHTDTWHDFRCVFERSDYGSIGMSVADVDGDGRGDVVLAITATRPDNDDWYLQFEIYLGGEDGLSAPFRFYELLPVGVPFDFRHLHLDLADIDSDGDYDIFLFFVADKTYDVYDNQSSVGAPRFDRLTAETIVRTGSLQAGPRLTGAPGLGTDRTSTESSLGNMLAPLSHGDVNSDGFLDILFADPDTNNVGIRYGDGTGALADPTWIPAGVGPLSTGLIDINQDGFLDIITGNSNGVGDGLNVMFGDGAGSFTAPIESLSGGILGFVGMALKDLNRDGCLDAVVGSTNGVDESDVAVMPGNCTGKFGVDAVGLGGIAFPTGVGPVSVSLGDIDGDGDLDAVTVNEDRTISELLGNGHGAFGPATTHEFTDDTLNMPRAGKLADMDGDGALDSYLVVSSHAALHWLANDVIYPEGNRTGVFAGLFYHWLSYTPGAAPLEVGDVDNDGRPDVVTTDTEYDNLVVVFGPTILAAGETLTQINYPTRTDPRAMALGDLNGDQRPDVVLAYDLPSSNVSVLINQGGGARSALFGPAVHYTADEAPVHVALHDVDGDGDLDIITANSNSFGDGHEAASVLLGAGDGTFALDRHYDVGAFARKVLLGDADNDGHVDLLVQSTVSPLGGGSLYMLRGDGSGIFWVPTPLLPGLVADLALGDMNGNVELDLVTVDHDNNRVNVWLSSINFCPDDPDNDIDDDQVCGNVDNCPSQANADQADADDDGAGDACDVCPSDADDDVDTDGVCGDLDNCPAAANSGQGDADTDGLGDGCDACPNDPDDDLDSDGVCGDLDNCPAVANAGQADADSDGLGDACDDCGNDSDNDPDGDGVCGDTDNCPNAANADQLDTDGDGAGNACDACPSDPNDDADGDGLCADADNCPDVDNVDQLDVDADGIGDVCDACVTASDGDIDRDGVCGDLDNCPGVGNPDQADADGDGLGDVCDPINGKTPGGSKADDGCSCSVAASSPWLLALLWPLGRRRRRRAAV